jgi:hypothetical protein
MNALDNVERRDSGTASQDRASAAYFNDNSEQEARQTQQVNAACDAIRKMDMTPETVRQLISTISCRMKICGFSDNDIELIEYAGDTL